MVVGPGRVRVPVYSQVEKDWKVGRDATANGRTGEDCSGLSSDNLVVC